MKVHDLKTWEEPFSLVWTGLKKYEVRKNDRDFGLGDLLVLREVVAPTLTEPEAKEFTGRWVLAEVVCVTFGGRFGLPPDLCVLGLSEIRRSP